MSMLSHRWRSDLLGERLELDLPQGRLEAFRRGDGPPLVFAHGWLANANLWRHVVDRLADRFSCVALDLPLGAHRVALPEADLTPVGCAALIAAALTEPRIPTRCHASRTRRSWPTPPASWHPPRPSPSTRRAST
jgi:pimeloyl-ACP methyl ester carboxylesterase